MRLFQWDLAVIGRRVRHEHPRKGIGVFLLAWKCSFSCGSPASTSLPGDLLPALLHPHQAWKCAVSNPPSQTQHQLELPVLSAPHHPSLLPSLKHCDGQLLAAGHPTTQKYLCRFTVSSTPRQRGVPPNEHAFIWSGVQVRLASSARSRGSPGRTGNTFSSCVGVLWVLDGGSLRLSCVA